LIAFLFGWMEFSVLRAGSLAGIAYVLAAYLKNFIDMGPGTEKMIAVLSIVFFTALNIFGLRYGTGTQNILSSLKVLTLLFMFALIFGSGVQVHPSESEIVSSSDNTWWALAPALIPILWSYGGWNESTFMSGEFKDTHRSLPRSLITSILIITGLYVFINAAYLKAMSPADMIHSESIASDIFMKLFGQTGFLLMSLAVLISASGALNSTILTGARIPFAVAQDSRRLQWLGNIHGRFDTPAHAFVLNGVWASLLILWGNFRDLLFFTGFAKWFFFLLAGFSVFILRKRARHPETFRMVGYPWVPCLFILVSAVLFVTTIYHAQRSALFGFLLLILGIPIYFLLHRPHSE